MTALPMGQNAGNKNCFGKMTPDTSNMLPNVSKIGPYTNPPSTTQKSMSGGSRPSVSFNGYSLSNQKAKGPAGFNMGSVRNKY